MHLQFSLNDSHRIEIIDLDNMDNKKHIMRYRAFCIIVNYIKYEGTHSEEIMDFIDRFEFNLNSNVDLNIVFFMIKVCIRDTTMTVNNLLFHLVNHL